MCGQIDWIVDHKTVRNIQFVGVAGDLTNDSDSV
jgi:hypothetical protein